MYVSELVWLNVCPNANLVWCWVTYSDAPNAVTTSLLTEFQQVRENWKKGIVIGLESQENGGIFAICCNYFLLNALRSHRM